MTEKKETVESKKLVAGTPKRRRGVSNVTKAVSQLQFNEVDAHPKLGLFTGHLVSVEVDTSIKEDAKVFTGKPVPRVTLHFASNHANVNEQRHYYHTIFPVPSNTETCIGGDKEWRVTNVMNWLKHILDVFYLKGRELTLDEETALMLDFEDADEQGMYISVEEDTVLAAYRSLFENFASMMNGTFAEVPEGETPKPCFRNGNGQFIKIWLKLLRCKKVKNSWSNVTANGALAFDGFIGAGAIELFKEGTNPSILRIDPSMESITPKEVNKKPSIGGINAMGSVTMGDGMPGMGSIPTGEDYGTGEMPF